MLKVIIALLLLAYILYVPTYFYQHIPIIRNASRNLKLFNSTRPATRNRDQPKELLNNYYTFFTTEAPYKILNNTGFTHLRCSSSLRHSPSNATEQVWDYLTWRPKKSCHSKQIRNIQSPKNLYIANHGLLSQSTIKKRMSKISLHCYPRSLRFPSQLVHQFLISLAPVFCSSLTSNYKTEKTPHKISLSFFQSPKKQRPISHKLQIPQHNHNQ
jgi:hypothetical protein